MTAKKILLVAGLVFAGLLVVFNPLSGNPSFAGEPQTSIAVQVPQAINEAIAIGFVALLALGAAYVFEKTGLDLRGFAAPLAITISAWVVAELQNIINTIPESYDPTADFVFKVIVLLLGSVGLLRFRKPNVPVDDPAQGLLS